MTAPNLANALREREERVKAHVQVYTTRLLRNELSLTR